KPIPWLYADVTDSKIAMSGLTRAAYSTKSHMHWLIFASSPRRCFDVITENPEQGGLPMTTSAPPLGTSHSVGTTACAVQSPVRCRLASQFAIPKPPLFSTLCTS